MSAPVFEKDLTGLLAVDPYNDFISEGGILGVEGPNAR
jgi:ureidoacrylate peracid hydrolase